MSLVFEYGVVGDRHYYACSTKETFQDLPIIQERKHQNYWEIFHNYFVLNTS